MWKNACLLLLVLATYASAQDQGAVPRNPAVQGQQSEGQQFAQGFQYQQGRYPQGGQDILQHIVQTGARLFAQFSPFLGGQGGLPGGFFGVPGKK